MLSRDVETIFPGAKQRNYVFRIYAENSPFNPMSEGYLCLSILLRIGCTTKHSSLFLMRPALFFLKLPCSLKVYRKLRDKESCDYEKRHSPSIFQSSSNEMTKPFGKQSVTKACRLLKNVLQAVLKRFPRTTRTYNLQLQKYPCNCKKTLKNIKENELEILVQYIFCDATKSKTNKQVEHIQGDHSWFIESRLF